MKTFNLPDLGEGLPEAELLTWHVSPGDHVVTDQPLVSVETDKAVVEVPSPQGGRVARLHAEEGEMVKTGAPLVDFESDDDAADADAGTVVGEVGRSDTVVAEQPLEVGSRGGGLRATPAVRALATRLGVDLGSVTPSGPNDSITKADVERVASIYAETGPLEPLRGVRRAMATNMARAHAEVAGATVMDDADIHAWPPGTDPMLRLLRALVAGVRAEPALNVWYDAEDMGRRVIGKIDVGIAVDGPEGLFVPTLRDVGNRSPEDLRQGLDAMIAAVRTRSVPAEELRGATILLSNFGPIGGRYASPMVVPPAVAILGAGRARDAVVPFDGQPAVHRTLPLSVTFDHRVVTGGEAARFLEAARRDLESGD